MNTDDAGQEGGRAELRRAIAERVMGWEVLEYDPTTWGDEGNAEKHRRVGDAILGELPPVATLNVEGEMMVARKSGSGRWHPDEDLAVAQEVIEEIQRRNPGVRFSLLGRPEEFGWVAKFVLPDDPGRPYGSRYKRGYADTPALAICRATLAVLSESPSPQTEAEHAD